MSSYNLVQHHLRQWISVASGATFSAGMGDCSDLIPEEEVTERSPLEEEIVYIKETSLGVMPNPFAGETTITYELAETGNVSIQVFDVNGKEVANLLAAGQQAAGKHEVTYRPDFSAKGIYTVVLRTANEVITKRMVVLR
ncbi:MAG: T9SS type A sorting domain-containing protein [Saprospiraceae bacterium]